jgi:predicted O-methyltransferase YrrM
VAIEPSGATGFSGDKLVGALQRFARYQSQTVNTAYVEVGVFQGLALTATAIAAPDLPVFGIDNFSQFDPQGKNQAIATSRLKENGVENALIIDKDYEDALETMQEHLEGRKISVYFIDGPHDYRSQMMCLELVKPYLAESAIIIVDDSNYRHVRLANRDFLVSHPEFKLFFEAYTETHPANAPLHGEKMARAGWWNGVNIIVRDPLNILSTEYPPTVRNRDLYVNEHIVHADRYGALAPEAIALSRAIIDLRPLNILRALARLWKAKSRLHSELRGDYSSMNTFGSDLPNSRFNSSVEIVK